jgi:hypothetical protein
MHCKKLVNDLLLLGVWHTIFISCVMPSAVVKYYKYNADNHTLTIHYVSGMVYEYLEVPEAVFDELKQSKSKGTYLNKFIKGRFDYRKVA